MNNPLESYNNLLGQDLHDNHPSLIKVVHLTKADAEKYEVKQDNHGTMPRPCLVHIIDINGKELFNETDIGYVKRYIVAISIKHQCWNAVLPRIPSF
jgi:hypothetical protein